MRASKDCARLRFLAVASANIWSRWWLMVVRFSCSSFCCSGVIEVLFRAKNETVVIEQRQGVGGQLVQQRILEAQRGLYRGLGLLLAKDIGYVIGAKRTGGISFVESGKHRIRPIFPNQSEQLADLSGQGAVRVGQPAQIEFTSWA